MKKVLIIAVALLLLLLLTMMISIEHKRSLQIAFFVCAIAGQTAAEEVRKPSRRLFINDFFGVAIK